jgi:hypothetical protein
VINVNLKQKSEELIEGREGSVSLPLKLLAAVFAMAVLGLVIYKAYERTTPAMDEMNRTASNYMGQIGAP